MTESRLDDRARRAAHETAGHRPALACPKCQGVLLRPSRLARPDGVAVDTEACPACEGVWFDARALGASLQQAPTDMAVPGFAMAARRVICPRCQVHLFEFCLPGTQVLVDGCRRCQGMWLDKGEWPRIGQALADAALQAAQPRHACPKCRAMQGSSTQCERCGAVFAKVREQQQLDQAFEQQQRARAEGATLQAYFGDAVAVNIRQRVEWLEILSPFERANRYEVMLMGARNRFATVQEHSRSILNAVFRQLLGGLRPAHLTLQDEHGQTLLTMDKPFRLYFHSIALADAQGVPLGEVHRRFHWLRENYDVLDRRKRLVAQIRGPLFFLPFVDAVFRFMHRDQEVGRMVKRWRGVVREHFTDADAFHASFSHGLPLGHKVLLFGAVFLIDFGHFENNDGGGGFSLDDIT